MTQFQAREDGWGAVARVGVVVPHADVGPESELQAMAPRDVYIHGSRVHFGAMRPGGEMDPKIPHDPVRAFIDPPFIDDAVELLAASPLDSIALGFTSSAYVLGADGEQKLFERLAERTRGIPLTGTTHAAAAGFHALGAERIALVNPPWFDDELSALGASYFGERGFDVVHHAPCGLPSNQKLITPEALVTWIETVVAPQQPQAVLVAGNGIRAVGAIAGLEERLGFPVLTANQVLFWHALHAAGGSEAAARITDYGALFGVLPEGAAAGVAAGAVVGGGAMSLLPAYGYQAAVQETCDTPEYHLPLVCWHDDGTGVRGMVLYRGALRPAEQVPGFRRYLASEDLEQYATTGPWPLLAATA